MTARKAEPTLRVLVVDVGGTNIKIAIAGERRVLKLPSGPDLTPSRMVHSVREAVRDWSYDVITMGYPGPVKGGRPQQEPHNLAAGWTRFSYARAFGCPVRIVNDAAMQALGSYRGRRMLFLGLGTGLGSAIVDHGKVQPLELAHLPYREGKSYEDYVGVRGLKRLGRQKWEHHVHQVTELLRAGLLCDYVVLGGGNVKKLITLPPFAARGNNLWAFRGGGRVWTEGALVAR
ncbi:MAG: ROK family protein [Cytophagaceae bacterium]|nr:ROK family protein [Gemmatimonadaceae bacterium]